MRLTTVSMALVLSTRSAFLAFEKNLEIELRVFDGYGQRTSHKGENCQCRNHSVLA